MKAILVIDMPNNCEECKITYFQEHGESSTCYSGDWSKRPSWCPLTHPLKYVSNDFYIYDRKYLFDNLEREIDLLKSAKKFEDYMRSKDESNISD